jgi:hypothetical protein
MPEQEMSAFVELRKQVAKGLEASAEQNEVHILECDGAAGCTYREGHIVDRSYWFETTIPDFCPEEFSGKRFPELLHNGIKEALHLSCKLFWHPLRVLLIHLASRLSAFAAAL